jgi:hypothetical protein
MSDQNDIQMKIAGSMGLDEGGAAAVRSLFSICATYKKAAVDTTLLETYLLKVWTNPYTYSVKISRAVYNPDATLTANTSNYATVALQTDDAANGTPATAKVFTTSTVAGGGSGDFVADTQVLFPSSGDVPAELDVAPGANVFLSVAKAGAGILVPAGVLAIELHRL